MKQKHFVNIINSSGTPIAYVQRFYIYLLKSILYMELKLSKTTNLEIILGVLKLRSRGI